MKDEPQIQLGERLKLTHVLNNQDINAKAWKPLNKFHKIEIPKSANNTNMAFSPVSSIINFSWRFFDAYWPFITYYARIRPRSKMLSEKVEDTPAGTWSFGNRAPCSYLYKVE